MKFEAQDGPDAVRVAAQSTFPHLKQTPNNSICDILPQTERKYATRGYERRPHLPEARDPRPSLKVTTDRAPRVLPCHMARGSNPCPFDIV